MVKGFLKACCASFLTLSLFTTSSLAVTGRVTGTNVRIRESADSKAFEVSVATKNEIVDVIGEEGNWYKVNFENVTGYISKDYVDTDYKSEEVSSSSASLQTTPEPDPDPVSNTVVTEPEDNQASTETPTSSETTPTSSTTETLQPEEPEQVTQQPEVKEEQRVTFEKETDLKYLPSFTSRNSVKASSGSTYTVKASLNNWIKVENETNSGWVLKNNVKNVDEDSGETSSSSETTPTTSTTETPQPEEPVVSSETPTQDSSKKGVVNVESARIRKSPDGEPLDSLKEGTEVTILGEENGWYKIKTDDYESCYIAKRLINEK